MAKKKNNLWVALALFLGLLLIAGAIFHGAKQGWFQSSVNVITNSSTVNMLENPNPSQINPSRCQLYLSDNEICLGDNVTGEIKDGANNLCWVYASDGTWRKVWEGYTNAQGLISETHTINILGHFNFRAICDMNDNLVPDVGDCVTNGVELDVIPCPDDGDDSDSSGYTCGWVGEQCGGTCPESYPLCIDMWMDDIIHGGYYFCGCVDSNSGTVHPDWKPDGQYHDDSGIPEEEEIPQTIGQYCNSLGYDKHWDTPLPGNCPQAAENECGVGSYAYMYDYEQLWCCYRCE